MPDSYKIPLDAAMEAYTKEASPSLTDKLLYPILAQLDKLNEQVADLRENESDGENESE